MSQQNFIFGKISDDSVFKRNCSHTIVSVKPNIIVDLLSAMFSLSIKYRRKVKIGSIDDVKLSLYCPLYHLISGPTYIIIKVTFKPILAGDLQV